MTDMTEWSRVLVFIVLGVLIGQIWVNLALREFWRNNGGKEND